MKLMIILLMYTFSITSFAEENTSRVLAEVTKNLQHSEKIELIGTNLGSSDAAFQIKVTAKDGKIQNIDANQFSSYIRVSISHLSQDEVAVAEITRHSICFIASPDNTSTLFVTRYSRIQDKYISVKILDQYGCQTVKPTLPLNNGDRAVAEGLLSFIKGLAGE